MRKKYWDKEEEDLLIKLRELGYTYKQISIEIGRSVGSCIKKYNRLTNPNYVDKERQYYQDNRDRYLEYAKQYCENNRDKITEYQKQYREDNKEYYKQYHKQYYEDNKDKISEYKKQYYQDNKNKHLEYANQYYEGHREYFKKYHEDNRDKHLEYCKQHYQDNRDKRLQYQKQYRQDNKDKIAEYKRNYDAQNPEKNIRKERYNGEFADIQLCHKFYNSISPITGTKDDLQVHHLISIRDNIDFWQSAADEEKINYLILIPKNIHMAYHSWLGGTKVESTPESFWEFIDNIYFNKQI